MKKKIIGILICMVLFSTVFPATGNPDEKTMTSMREIESIPVLEFKNISRGLLGFSVELTNSGEGTTGNIKWSKNVSGEYFGFYLFDIPFLKNALLHVFQDVSWDPYGEIDTLGHDQSDMVKIGLPFLGFGQFNIFFDCTYTIYTKTNLSANITVIQEYVGELYYVWFTFPEGLQPERKWVNITVSTYIDGGWVHLLYDGPPHGLLQLHNVRVWNPESDKTEFLGACKFTNGTATIQECHVTQDIVESGSAYWQVELVNNE